MGGIDGVAAEARSLADSLIRNVAAYEVLIDEMGSLVKGLNAGWADEKYDQVVQSVTAMQNKVKTVNENLTQMTGSLHNYAEYLDMLKQMGVI